MPGSDWKIDRAETLRYLGWRGQALDADMERRIDAMSARCLAAARPAWCYTAFDLVPSDHGVGLAGTDTVLRGGDIAAHLRGAEKVVLMAATLGHGCDRTYLSLQTKSITDAMCFNAASVALVEAAADRCQREIAEKYRAEGYHINARYSPGYGDFPLDAQPELLKLLNAEKRLGITLTESCLMLPRKSVTAVLGLFREEQEAHTSCLSCAMREGCDYRKTGEHCG